MSLDLTRIQTVVVLMLENRSFDHLFTHLKLAGHPIDGIEGRLGPDGRIVDDRYANGFEGLAYYPFQTTDHTFGRDLPHERESTEVQLARSPITQKLTMRGFVKAYFGPDAANRTDRPDPMGFLRAEDVPVTSALAREYAICDRWFGCVPSDTSTNRLMSLSGFTKVDRQPATTIPFLPNQPTMLDWMSARGVRWRVYRNGLSFFALLPQYLDDVALGRGFRSVSHLGDDVLNEPDATFPQVILVEPSYLESPVDLEDPPNDNHPTLPMAPGEAYVKRIYDALAANPARWAGTLFVLTYDEHGGFYDHVPPPPLVSPVPPGASYTAPFTTAGVRTPAVVISPLVKKGSVYSGLLDNTSILQLLAERFDPQSSGYSPEVNSRRAQGVQSLSAVLDPGEPRADQPVIAQAPAASAASPVIVPTRWPAHRPPTTPLRRSFTAACERLRANPAWTAAYPELKD